MKHEEPKKKQATQEKKGGSVLQVSKAFEKKTKGKQGDLLFNKDNNIEIWTRKTGYWIYSAIKLKLDGVVVSKYAKEKRPYRYIVQDMPKTLTIA